MKGLIILTCLVMSVSGCASRLSSDISLPLPIITKDTSIWSAKNNGGCGPNKIIQFDFSLKKTGEWHAEIHFYSFQKLGSQPWQSQISLVLQDHHSNLDGVSLDIGTVAIEPHTSFILEETGVWRGAASLLLKMDDISDSRLMLHHQCQKEAG